MGKDGKGENENGENGIKKLGEIASFWVINCEKWGNYPCLHIYGNTADTNI